MSQMKDQNNTPEKELKEMEITKLSDAEFKTLVIRMLIEYCNKIKKNQEEMKVTISKIKSIGNQQWRGCSWDSNQ